MPYRAMGGYMALITRSIPSMERFALRRLAANYAVIPISGTFSLVGFCV
jgi:hypothetical protein